MAGTEVRGSTPNNFLDLVFPTETSVVKTDKFDEMSYNDVFTVSQDLKNVEEKGTSQLSVFPDLQEDIYASVYKRKVTNRQENDLKSSHRLNHKLITEMQSSNEYEHMRNMTQGDQVASTLATVALAESLADKLGHELKEETERANRIKQMQDIIINSQGQVSNLQQLIKAAKASGNKEQASQLQKMLSKEMRKGNSTTQALMEALKQQNSSVMTDQNIKSAIRHASSAAAQEVENTLDAFATWGDGGCGYKYGQVRMDERLALAMHIRKSSKLKKVAEMLGRFKRMAAFAQKAKLVQGSEEIYDLTLGSDLSRLVPSELQELLDSRKKDFYKKFLEGGLVQYALKGNMPAGAGPVVVCLDSSGSIKELQDVWQKAVALSVLDIAQKQKRAYACILFGGSRDPLDTTIIEVHDPDISAKAVHIAETFYGYGGTSFKKPLGAAQEIIGTKEFAKADILFCTDGHCAVDSDWLSQFLAWKAQNGVRIQSVLLDIEKCTTATISEFSNEIFNVSTLNESAITEKIFEGI